MAGCEPIVVNGLLRELVRTYRSERLESEVAYYTSLRTLEEVIDKAAMARDPRGLKRTHSGRIPMDALAAWRDRLLAVADQIRACPSFDCILAIVEEHRVPKIGPVTIYDTALLIGAYLDKWPTKVHLHAGVKDGAKALGLDVSRGWLEIDELPKPLRKLKPYEIGNLLCRARKRFLERCR